MTTDFLVSSVARYWYLPLLGLLLGALAAVGVKAALPDRYESSATMLISTTREIRQPTEASNYVVERMPTYAALVTTRPVLDEATRVLGVEVPHRTLAGRVTATVEESTVLLTVTAEWSEPREAARVANAVARAYTEVAPRLDNGVNEPLLRAAVIEPAFASNQTAGLGRPIFGAIGAILGTSIGVLVALLWSVFRRRKLEADTVAEREPSAHHP